MLSFIVSVNLGSESLTQTILVLENNDQGVYFQPSLIPSPNSFCIHKPCWLIPGLGPDFGTFHWLRETPSPVFPWSCVITILAFVFTLVSTISLRFCLPYQLWPWEPVSSTLCLCSPAWGLVHREALYIFLNEWMNEWMENDVSFLLWRNTFCTVLNV